jgi:hypothetical protein
LIRRNLLGGAVLVQRHPWLLHRVQADHVAFGIDHEGNVAVLANQRESASPNPQPREQTLPDGRDMCAKPLQQGRATDRVDGILGLACHVKELGLEMDHPMHGVGPNAQISGVLIERADSGT